eukprot:m.61696 g.61696  ORF g.61696 m.61696 type:complete len:293 (+) comp13353_c0_seq1:1131-2009(+)
MLLVTFEREGKFHLRETKDVIPVIKLNNLTDIKGEMTAGSTDRTTLMLEIGAPAREMYPPPSPLMIRDSPRPIVRPPERKYMRFETGATAHLKTWVVQLLRAREAVRMRSAELQRTQRQGSYDFPECEFAVTLLVSTRFQDDNAVTNRETIESLQQQVPDWEISFEQEDSGQTVVETTRHVRVFQGPDGLGLTLIGKNPVEIQEVDEQGPAFAAGLRPGDAIRAVDGQECTALSHDEVIALIRNALLSQRREWQPVDRPLDPIPDAENDDLILAAQTRGPHKTKKMTFLMDI